MDALNASHPLTLYSQNLEQVQSLAKHIALTLQAGDTIALSGDLGSGKTAFCRALIQAIAPGVPDVTSPTFMLMQSYDVVLGNKAETLWHLDLYRLKHMSEAYALGLEELWAHIVLIEWPEIIASLLPQDTLRIAFSCVSGDAPRDLHITANDTWLRRLAALW